MARVMGNITFPCQHMIDQPAEADVLSLLLHTWTHFPSQQVQLLCYQVTYYQVLFGFILQFKLNVNRSAVNSVEMFWFAV